MIQLRGIDHVNLSVRDLDRAVDFYQRLFGFEMREDGRRQDPPWVILGHQARVYLALHQGQAGRQAGSGFNHWGFNVENFDAALESLAKAGVQPRYVERGDGGVIRYPGSRSLYIADPDGYEIELTETFGGGLG